MVQLLDKMTTSQVLTLFVVLIFAACFTIVMVAHAIRDAVVRRYEDEPVTSEDKKPEISSP